ncbi:MAG TPA: 2-oxoglutarate and iron-dependent oxygenase domain-containing protein [Alphaproteobacteria bacterium]
MDDVKVHDVRGELRDDAEAVYLMDHPDSAEEIPTLDLAPYLQGHPGGREAVAAHLREISRTVGFFYLKGHGLPPDLIDRIFAQSRRFHALPEAEKRKIPYFSVGSFKSGYHGTFEDDYRRSNVNIIRGAKPNLMAKFSVNREGGSGGPSMSDEERRAVVNAWPEALPGFKETVTEYHAAIERLGRQFLPLWSVSLNLAPDYFDKFFATPHLTMQLLHYPPQKEVGNRQYGIAPHTDNAMMTFLAQADVPGLAVRMPSGHWRAVDVIPGTLLVNTGNVIVRWTNDEYLSTKHRVINTHDVDRYSLPVFFGPSGDAVIEVLPTCQGPDRPPRYEPMTYRASRDWYYAPPK